MDIKEELVDDKKDFSNVFVHIPTEKTFTEIYIKQEEAHDEIGLYICAIVQYFMFCVLIYLIKTILFKRLGALLRI